MHFSLEKQRYSISRNVHTQDMEVHGLEQGTALKSSMDGWVGVCVVDQTLEHQLVHGKTKFAVLFSFL